MEAATVEHCLAVYADLRQPDAQELALLGIEPEEAVAEMVSRGEVFAVLVDEAPVALWGVVKAGPIAPGRIWFLTTNAVDEFGVRLGRESVKMCDSLLQSFGALEGVVQESNVKALRYLRWLGFNLSEPFDFPPVGAVRRFEKGLL